MGSSAGHERRRLDQRGVRAVDAVEAGKAHGDHLEFRLGGEIDQRRKEVVPRKDQVEQRHGDDHGRRHGHDDAGENSERAGAVDGRRLVDLARDGHEVLAQEKDVVGVGKEVRHRERQPGAHPADVVEERKGRHHGDGRGQEDGGDEQREEQIAPWKAEAREAVRHHDTRKQRADDADDGDGQGIDEKPAEIDRVPSLAGSLPRWVQTSTAAPATARSLPT